MPIIIRKLLQVQDLGLTGYYKENAEFKHFLPPNEVRDGMAYLGNNAVPNCEALLDYFDATYVSGAFRCIQQAPADGEAPPQMRFRRQPPLFPPQLWNVFDATMRQEDRTNNICEAWNQGFSQLVGHDHPSVFRLLSHIKEDEALTRVHILQEAHGQPPRKRVKRQTKDLQERLQYLCQQRVSGDKTMIEFLRAIGHTIRLA